MVLQLYVHFPFCKAKCFYCDFCSHPAGQEEMLRYCAALEKEILSAGKKWIGAEVSTVFIGGGTPSLVPEEGMERVLRAMKSSFAFRPDVEFTSEANPGTLRENWLELMQRYGMNRLSLGVQAAQDALLKRIGRIHTFAEARQAVEMARRSGIRNLNMDLMFGLPGQSAGEWRETLDAACHMEPEHISAYSLILEENTRLFDMVERGQISVPDDDAAAEMYSLAREVLTEKGYSQYEISNYAREGKRCRHNVGYWQGAYYLGLGVNAHGMMPPARGEDARWIRLANVEDTGEYIRRMEAGEDACALREAIGEEEAMFETMMLGLRMNDGVQSSLFTGRFGRAMEQVWPDELESLVRDGLGMWTGGGFRLTDKGLLMQNEALLRLMK